MLGEIAAGAQIAGSIFGAMGASKQASALRKASKKGQKDIAAFTKDQVEKSDKLGSTKQQYLEEGDPFTDMGKFIFGDSSLGTYSNLRKTQADFAKLAAGDTTGFQKEVSSMVANSLASTFGGPRGSFENLSAKNLLNFRQLGASTAMSLTDYFAKSGQQLIGNKFGVLDQTFDRQMRLKEYETNAINQLRMQAAGAQGVEMAGIGNIFNAVGGGLSSINAMQSNQQALQAQQSYQNRYLDFLFQSVGGAPKRTSGYSGGSVNVGNSFNDPLPSNYNSFAGNQELGSYDPNMNIYVNPRQPYTSTLWDRANNQGVPSNQWGASLWNYIGPPPSVLPDNTEPTPSY